MELVFYSPSHTCFQCREHASSAWIRTIHLVGFVLSLLRLLQRLTLHCTIHRDGAQSYRLKDSRDFPPLSSWMLTERWLSTPHLITRQNYRRMVCAEPQQWHRVVAPWNQTTCCISCHFLPVLQASDSPCPCDQPYTLIWQKRKKKERNKKKGDSKRRRRNKDAGLWHVDSTVTRKRSLFRHVGGLVGCVVVENSVFSSSLCWRLGLGFFEWKAPRCLK